MPEEEKENTHVENAPLQWIAPGRPFKKRSKQFYLTALLIMFLIEVILFLFSEYLLMVVVVSLVFVAFSLAAIPPKDFHYRISDEGIMIEDGFYIWRELYDFYFKNRDGVKTVHLGTHAFLPGELIVTLGDMDEEKVKEALIPYLPYREYVKPTMVEKSADWLTKNFPLENK